MSGSKNVLCVKLSNAQACCGVFSDGVLMASWSTATQVMATPDDLELSLRGFLQAKGIVPPDQAILCSVVPAATAAWTTALRLVCGVRPLVVGPGLKTGLPLGYKDPAQMGSDRVVNAVAAKQLFGGNVMVVDFSHTTTNFSVIDEEGAFVGGVIAPGLTVSMDALASSAAQLVPLSIRAPKSVLGRSTADAVQAGVVMGEVLRADGFVDALWRELGHETQLVATGTYAKLVAGLSAHEFVVEPNLALTGLYALWKLNSKYCKYQDTNRPACLLR